MTRPAFIPLPNYRELSVEEMKRRAADFRVELSGRRTVRQFSKRMVDAEVIKDCVATACSAPSGANRQPWHFAVVSDPKVKRQIREAAEDEERLFYGERAPEKWLEALAPIGTDDKKPFLESAPYLIVMFAQTYELDSEGEKNKNYYVQESVGIACGMLIAALHHAGVASLTHTPSPMRFLADILKRPENERPYMLLVAGYPESNAMVPNIERKPLAEVTSFF